MELNAEWQRKSPAERRPLGSQFWQQPLEPDYWQALLNQGQIALPAMPAGGSAQAAEDAAGMSQPPDTTPDDGSGRDESRWEQARAAMDGGAVYDVRVSGANRGGLLVEWNGLQGFVPASHLKIMPRHAEQTERVSELSSRVGEWLQVRLIEVDTTQRRLVCSERAAVADAHAAASILNRLAPGDVCSGVVTNVTTFGAFVELGGVEGLVHISELSWDRVRHPADVLRPGQEVRVHVLGVNADQERVALSLKRLRPNPWSMVEQRYTVGQLIEGTVTNVVSFGAFVRLEEGLEGLIHISELAEGNFLHPRNVVREGDVVTVRVLNIDTDNRRLGLSMRQAYSPGFSG